MPPSLLVGNNPFLTKILHLFRDERNMERLLCFQAREEEIHNEFLTTVIRVIEPQIKYFNELLKTPPRVRNYYNSALEKNLMSSF